MANKLRIPLLGAPVIEALGLVKGVGIITKEESRYREEFPSRLGKLEEEYKIQLKGDAQLFALSTPCRVTIPLMPKVQVELKKLGLTGKVENPLNGVKAWWWSQRQMNEYEFDQT